MREGRERGGEGVGVGLAVCVGGHGGGEDQSVLMGSITTIY